MLNDVLDEIVRMRKPILVSAGPGMGKTFTLAYKLKYLIKNEGIRPDGSIWGQI